MFLCGIDTFQVRRGKIAKRLYMCAPMNRSRTLGLEENLEGSHITNFKKTIYVYVYTYTHMYVCLCNLCVSML